MMFFDVTINRVENCIPKVTNNNNSIYSVDFLQKSIGKHRVSVLNGGKHISGPPFNINVLPGVDQFKTTVEEPKKLKLGEVAKFKINPKNNKDEPQTLNNEDDLVIEIDGPQKEIPNINSKESF